jgi:dTDP-4-dehydrorhamnose reductase
VTIRARMSTIFVTGLAGYLGAELADAAGAEGWRVGGTVHQRPGPPQAHRVDVRDRGAVAAAIASEVPDVVVHTAYRRDDESVTVDGARIVAEAAAQADARLIHLSSDLVFGGDLRRPLTEEDAPDPRLDYGRWKARAEGLVREAHPAALLVRTSLIYGERSSSDHERLALAAAEGTKDLTFFTDELRNPVEVGDLAKAILELARKEVNGPLHVAGPHAMDRLELARLLVVRRGRDPEALRGGPGGPDRPKDCRLDCSRARTLLSTRLRGAREVLAA